MEAGRPGKTQDVRAAALETLPHHRAGLRMAEGLASEISQLRSELAQTRRDMASRDSSQVSPRKRRRLQRGDTDVCYVVVTGGVMSGLGKGITASSIGRLLKDCGWSVTAIKIDPCVGYTCAVVALPAESRPLVRRVQVPELRRRDHVTI